MNVRRTVLMSNAVVLLVGALVLLWGPVRADSFVLPHSYTVVPPGEQYVFVMLALVAPEDDGAGMPAGPAAQIQHIRRTYTISGLYRNDGSTTPLWSVDWYTYHVDVASDGIHLVRPGSGSRSADDVAVTFLAYGQPLRSLRIADIVDVPWLMPRHNGQMMWQADWQFDDQAMTHTIRTSHGEQVVFDVATGGILNETHPARWLSALVGGAIVFFAWAFRRMVRNP